MNALKDKRLSMDFAHKSKWCALMVKLMSITNASVNKLSF